MTDDSNAEHYYAHDHIFSVVAIVDSSGDIEEYYQYDAYGKCTIYTAGIDAIWYNSDDDEETTSTVGNPYMFTGRCVDSLDSDDLQLQYNRNRYYDYHTGRWLTQDPLGVTPNGYLGNSTLKPKKQYEYGTNLYEYVKSIPSILIDPFGLWHYDVEDPVKRSMQSRTLVLPDDGENLYDFVGLAQFVRLDPTEFSKWTEFRKDKCGYTVPNRAYVVRGDVSNPDWKKSPFGGFLMKKLTTWELDDIESHFEELGYSVTRLPYSNKQLLDGQFSSSNTIAWSFGGHGALGVLYLSENDESGDPQTYTSEEAVAHLHHRLAEVIILSCDVMMRMSDGAIYQKYSWLDIVSRPYGVLYASRGKLWASEDWEDLPQFRPLR